MKPPKINFHIHSTGSDGKMTPEEVVKEAIAVNVNFICFTDHYKVPEGIIHNLNSPEHHAPAYVKEVRRLQKLYANKIDISYGAEMDWFDEYKDWIKKEIEKNNFDYVLGSVHFLPWKEEYYSFDFGDKHKYLFDDVIKKFGSIEILIKEYYKQLKLMIKSGMYDAVGHFDYIKRYNLNEEYFLENSKEYKTIVLDCLDEVAKSKIAIEINLRGLLKYVKVQYPSLWILKEANKRKIPITIGTDAHKGGQVGDVLEKGYELAKKAGYKSIVRFKARKPIKILL